MYKITISKKIILLVLLTLCSPLFSQTTTIKLSDNFIDNENGTVTQQTTGLIWKRCSEGQTWDGKNKICLDNALKSDYQSALNLSKLTFADANDWRLPTFDELESLIDRKKIGPAIIDNIAFPNFSVSLPYWTSSLLFQYFTLRKPCYKDPFRPQEYAEIYWIINFSTGEIGTQCQYQESNVLLVRGGTAIPETVQTENAVYDAIQKILTINDVQIDNLHYRMQLKTIDLVTFIVNSMIILPNSVNNNSLSKVIYDSQNKILSIPRLKAFSSFYTVTFQNINNANYKLETASAIKG